MKTNTLPFDINSTLFASLVGSYHSKSNQIPSTPLSPQTLQLLRKEIRKLKEDAEQRIMVMQSNTLLVKEWIASSTSSSSVSSSLSTQSSATINGILVIE